MTVHQPSNTERTRPDEELKARARQQAAVAEIGQRALVGTDLSTLMDETVELIAQTLEVEYTKVLDLLPDGIALLLQAGVGWKEGYVGHATVGAEIDSQAGYTLLSNEPVIVEDLRTETRFSGPPLLHAHAVVSGMSVIIHGRDRPFGVLGAHTTRRRSFSRDDIHFLQAIANVLAAAIERKRAEEALLRTHDVLELGVQERTAGLSEAIDILEEQIAERHRAEEELLSSREELRALSARLLSVQEEERSRIAREIHDELGQALTALKIDLTWVAQRLAPNQEHVKKKTDWMAHLIDTTVQAVRRISTELRPRILDHLGLVAALEWQIREFQDRTGIACMFTKHPEEITVHGERATTVFRICQEALTNVGRHTNATRIDLSLTKVGRDLVLEVRDNGTGITKEAVADPKSLGLIGMRERVLPMGGDVTIKGVRGKGTAVTVRIPIREGGASLVGEST